MAFMDCTNLKITAIDTPDFSQVTSFSQAFLRSGVTSLNLKNVNLSSCTDFAYMFYGTTSLTSINLTGAILRTSSNVSMFQMFYNATNLTTITGFNTLNTSKVTDMGYFATGTKLNSIDLSGMDFSSCISFNGAFNYSKCNTVNVTNMILNTTSGVDFTNIFANCVINTLTGFKTLNTSKVTSIYNAFAGSLKMTGPLDLSGMDFSSCTNFAYTFYQCLFSSINVSNWVLNTSSNISMGQMFYGTSNMTALTGFNTLNTTKVTDMYFFAAGSKLGAIDMSGMNFSSCINFQSAFYYTQLTNVNVTNMILNTTNGVNLNTMFGYTNISTLTGFKTLNTSKVTSMNQIFVSSLKMSGSLDLSGMDFSSCMSFDYAFHGSVPSINVSNWTLNQSADLTMNYMFNSSIGTTQGISTWNVSRVTGMYGFNPVISSTEYTNTLVNWSALTLKPNVSFWVPGIKYNSSASSARTSIISNYNWTIVDGGLAA